MDTGEADLGHVVKSKAGRDKGRYFVVVGIGDGQHFYVADGDMRKIDRPKKKKEKHMVKLGIILHEVADKLKDGKKVTNAELRKNLKNLGYL